MFIKAHEILHRDLKHGDGQDIAGIIRTHGCAAQTGNEKSVQLTVPAGIPLMIEALFSDLNHDIANASLTGNIDTLYDLAARDCHRFVNIHPFSDGNGRICRLLLNTILLKYAGHVVYFGGDKDGLEMMEYLAIANRGVKKSRNEERADVPEAERVGHKELAEFALRSARKTGMLGS